MSDFNEGDALLPVLTITSGPLPDVGVVLIRFDFAAHAQAARELAHPGPNYVLTPVQACHLVERIQTPLSRLESALSLEAADTVH